MGDKDQIVVFQNELHVDKKSKKLIVTRYRANQEDGIEEVQEANEDPIIVQKLESECAEMSETV